MTFNDWLQTMKEIQEIRAMTTDQELLKELDDIEVMWIERMPTDCRGGQCE